MIIGHWRNTVPENNVWPRNISCVVVVSLLFCFSSPFSFIRLQITIKFKWTAFRENRWSRSHCQIWLDFASYGCPLQHNRRACQTGFSHTFVYPRYEPISFRSPIWLYDIMPRAYSIDYVMLMNKNKSITKYENKPNNDM